MQVDNDDQILFLPEVIKICGLSQSKIWQLQKSGLFPPHYYISFSEFGWRPADIEHWLNLKKNVDEGGGN